MGDVERKVEKDYSSEVDTLFVTIDSLVKSASYADAFEKLLNLEKKARVAGDNMSTGRILVKVLEVSHAGKDWKAINEYIVLLSKRRGQFKQATAKMIQKAMELVESTSEMALKLELIDTIRTVTEGKIFVECERARVTRLLSKIKEDKGDLQGAYTTLNELQVETFGSMSKREKTDFILEQMRLGLDRKELDRTGIISRKIGIKFLTKPENEDLKLRYYNLMIKLSLAKDEFFNVCKYYRAIYDTASIKEDAIEKLNILKHSVLYVILSPYDSEQYDLLNRIAQDKALGELELFKDLLKCFSTDELMRWPKIDEIFRTGLWETSVFDPKVDGGDARWKAMHDRVIEHNIRVLAKYYTRISFKRLAMMLDLSSEESEAYLSKLVVSGTIFARIDRPSGVVTFAKPPPPNVLLNEWSSSVSSLLKLIVKTTHLIAKEEMIHKIAQKK